MTHIINTTLRLLYIGGFAIVLCCIYNMYEISCKTNKFQSILEDNTNKFQAFIEEYNKYNSIIEELHTTHKLLYIQQNEDNQTAENSDDDSSNKSSTSPPLPIQNHITFPDVFVFDKKNYKQKKLNNTYFEMRFIGHDLRLVSNELAQFLRVKKGTCMEFDEAYKFVYNYIQTEQIINIGADTKLSLLFGINENEDYEYSDSMLVTILTTILEPHLKKLLTY